MLPVRLLHRPVEKLRIATGELLVQGLDVFDPKVDVEHVRGASS